MTDTETQPIVQIPASGPLDGPAPLLVGRFWPLCLALFIYATTTLALFHAVLFRNNGRLLSVDYSDLYNQFVGWTQFTGAQLQQGHVPLWNPHNYCGAPYLGGFQSALLYPPTWLILKLPVVQMLNWTIALHVFLAGLFTYVWMARRQLHPVGAIFSGFVFMFSGGYFLHIPQGHLPNLCTMVWAPLIFLAIDDLTTTRCRRGIMLGAFALGMQILAGHPQYVYYTLLIAAPYSLLRLRKALSPKWSAIALGLALIGAVGLSAAQLFAGLQAAGESMRSNLAIEVARTFAFPPENVLTAIMPDVFGQLNIGSYWGRWYLAESSIFMGSVAAALALYAVLKGDRAKKSLLPAMFILSIVLAMGFYTPLYSVLYRIIPGFSSFRGVSKFGFLAMLFASGLAGVGADRLLRTARLSRAGGATLVAAAACIGLLAVGLYLSGQSDKSGLWNHWVISRIDWRNEAYQSGVYFRGPMDSRFAQTTARSISMELVWCGGAIAIAGIFWLLARYHRWQWVYAILLLSGWQVIDYASRNMQTFNVAAISTQEGAIAQFAKGKDPDMRLSSGTPTMAMAAGASDVWGNDPMVLRRYIEFLSIGQTATPDQIVSKGSPFKGESRTWGMLRLKYIWKDTGPYGGISAQPVKAPQLPRASLLEQVEVMPDKATRLGRIAQATFDPSTSVILEQPLSVPLTSRRPAVTPGSASVVDHGSDEIEISADTARPCVLLMTDNYSRGWSARAEGDSAQKEYQLLPADHTFRAIPLAAGHHHIRLTYRPLAYVLGIWVSYGTCAGLAFYALRLLVVGQFRRQSIPVFS